ncbi:hypothetical protein BDV96DRAFT_132236 [Lophiotrema nucula]|uniref:Uncharacterized protein n=1 Tax=Lophiotrema nucula TaxID=690887 RepID=A0A6A5ZUH0_9PLEO|nr:hypothetical protein BDV96DRAFT_132236 [Lophiotrema nucula]
MSTWVFNFTFTRGASLLLLHFYLRTFGLNIKATKPLAFWFRQFTAATQLGPSAMANSSSDPLEGVEISERSKQFYSGQYRWDGIGFEDESGAFRHWGDEGPPTPLPPRPLSDLDFDENIEDIATEHQPTMNIVYGPLQAHYEALPPDKNLLVPHPALSPHFISKYTQYNPNAQPASPSVHVSVGGSAYPGKTYAKTLLKEGLFEDQPEPERQRNLGRVQGILIGMWYSAAGVSMKEAHELVGVPFEDGEISAAAGLVEMARGERHGKFFFCLCWKVNADAHGGGGTRRGGSRERTLTASPSANEFGPRNKGGTKQAEDNSIPQVRESRAPSSSPLSALPSKTPDLTGMQMTQLQALDFGRHPEQGNTSTSALPSQALELAEEMDAEEPEPSDTPKKKGTAVKKKATPVKKKGKATGARSPTFPRKTARQLALEWKKQNEEK